MRRQRKPSVLLVREWEQQLTGSGCCGKLEGDFLGCGEGAVFRDRRELMERMGRVYRAIKERFGDTVELQIVDPRNVGLLLMLARDLLAFRPGLGPALATLSRLPKQGVIANGRLIDRSPDPDPERIVQLLDGLVGGDPNALRTAALRS